ncbi:MAG: type II toxin-antitoxin system MqsA family antitoxin [Verrucomicrobia bacterium]|nr:type II toxin-antitoxin system MqsA family antitoxin [Verrucomicrobiota bacterium]
MSDLANTTCPACGEATLQTVKRDYIAPIGDGQKLRIPNIEMEVCDKCGEEILSLEAAREVDSAIAEYTDRLNPDELTAVRENFGVDKTEMSEVLGLGGKTYLRWEQGNQYPSRSMGYYLRVLREFPEAFAWLRSRGWRGRNRVATAERTPLVEMQHRFPALASDPSRLNALATTRCNFALILFAKK